MATSEGGGEDRSKAASAENSYTVEFSEVFRQEIDHICRRHKIRRMTIWRNEDLGSRQSVAEIEREDKPREQEPRLLRPIYSEFVTSEDAEDNFKSTDPQQREKDLSGLALSGGGIRSAAFAAGVLESLAYKGKLDRFDYLSTVSGGGYVGTALTWAITQNPDVSANAFPKYTVPQDGRGSGKKPSGKSFLLSLLEHIRQRANYLAPNNDITLMSGLLNTLRMSAASFSIYFVFALLLMTLLFLPIYRFSHSCNEWVIAVLDQIPWGGTLLVWGELFAEKELAQFSLLAVNAVAVTYLFSFVVYLIIYAVRPSFEGSHASRLRALGAFTTWSTWALVLFVFSLMPLIHSAARDAASNPYLYLGSALSLTGSGGSFLISHLQKLGERMRALMLRLAAFFLSVALLMAVFAVAYTIVINIDGSRFVQSIPDTAVGISVNIVIGSFAILLILKILKHISGHKNETEARSPIILWLAFIAGGAIGGLIASNIEKSRFEQLVTHVLSYIHISTVFVCVGIILMGLIASKWMKYRADIGDEFLLDVAALFAFVGGVSSIFTITLLFEIALPAEQIWLGERRLLAIFVLAGAIFQLLNPNNISPHRFYRDRLMETFMPSYRTYGFRESDESKLSDIFGASDPQATTVYRGAYHITNTNVILVRSRDQKFYQRGGDSFILSPLYCGSQATGWLRTKDHNVSRFRQVPDLTMATAMAISGAAANPNTAGGEDAITRRWAVSFLMTLFNIRLGYWQPNPRQAAKTGPAKTRPPNFLTPGVGSLISNYFSEDKRYIELSDGGHFDNTGLYELLRRKVKYIVLSDASCDPNYSLDDLGRALMLAYTEFGIEVEFDGLSPKSSTAIWKRLDAVREPPMSYRGKGYPLITDGTRAKLLQEGFITAKIFYPPPAAGQAGERGTLLYIKPALVSDAPADLLAYALANPDFPHQSTSDQFFTERRFESYHRLGAFIGDKAAAVIF
ncbi:patatin-like phospholipase family protein [Ferrovibrio terrae]|uniref:patatin-like phospholipase family protein n=2 Tax=Ferrovibrio terrae TaxID=2594003 RepID=UPI003137A80D